MRALSQMFGKDKIQSEEARQQFSERMPGGMRLLAEAAKNAGISKTGSVAEFEDIMKKGKGDPTKILPELAKLMENLADKNDAYAKSLLTTRVAQGRMNKAFEDSVVLFAEGGFDRGMASFFNALTDSMERAKPLTEALGAAFEILIKPVNALIRLVGHLGENWGKIADKLGMTKNQLATLAAAIGIFMLPFGGFIAAIGAAALALDDFLTYRAGGESVFGTWIKEAPGAEQAVGRVSEAWTTFQNSISSTVTSITTLLEKMGLLSSATKEVQFDSAFVSSLDKLASILNALSAAIDAIGKLASGDITGIGDALVRMKDSLGEYATKNLTDFAGSMLRTQAQLMIDNRPMGTQPGEGSTPATGVVDRGETITFDMSGFTLQLNMEGISNPKEFAEKLQPELQPMFEASLRNALGAARAQQAERQ
jgi:tape measure domain-containing protein